LLLSVTLSPPFGRAEVTAVPAPGEGMRLEVSVEVLEPAVAVLARGIGDVDELPPVALTDLGDGTWVGIVDLPVVDNIRMGFELIPERGPATVSELHTLVELGVDRLAFATEDLVTTTEAAGSAEADRETDADRGLEWIWLALAAGAAGLALLLLWAFAPRRSVEEPAPHDAAAPHDEEVASADVD
jgi:hypothetical protein